MFKIISVILLLHVCESGYCQLNTDGEYLLKMWFFIEHENIKSPYSTQFLVKDSSLFLLFERDINLRFDTLQSQGFNSDYIFLSVAFLKNDKEPDDSILIYDNKTMYLDYLSTPANNCDGYVLVINTVTGTSFRLGGFSGNDFLSLFQEIKEKYWETNNKHLSMKRFLKTYSIEGMDFNCIYKGLTSKKADEQKYSCLKHCKDYVIVIH